MLVIDLMYEFELVMWKAVFNHIIHILHVKAYGEKLETEWDAR